MRDVTSASAVVWMLGGWTRVMIDDEPAFLSAFWISLDFVGPTTRP